MGRFSEPLAAQFAQMADVQPGQRVLDVGCGPGALTAELVARLGSGAVWAIDPSVSFAAAICDRFPQVSVQRGVAEQLPFADRTFDAALGWPARGRVISLTCAPRPACATSNPGR
jgi:ubiquinone/menaquinone biosynthesis C-methylase UbiE